MIGKIPTTWVPHRHHADLDGRRFTGVIGLTADGPASCNGLAERSAGAE